MLPPVCPPLSSWILLLFPSQSPDLLWQWNTHPWTGLGFSARKIQELGAQLPGPSSVSNEVVGRQRCWGSRRSPDLMLNHSHCTFTILQMVLSYIFVWIKSSRTKEMWGNAGSRLTFPSARRGIWGPWRWLEWPDHDLEGSGSQH